MSEAPVEQVVVDEANRVADAAADAVEEGEVALRQGVDRAAESAKETAREVRNEARVVKDEAAATVNQAANKAANVADRAANKAANATNQAADAATQAANNAGAAANDFRARLRSGVDYITDRAQTYRRDPQQLGTAIRYQVDARVRDRLLVIFLLMLTPIWIMAIGSGFGTILKLFLSNLNYAAGILAAAYVWTLLNSTGPTPQYKVKILQLLLISSAVPVLVLDVENPVLKVFTLLAFGGAPFLLYLIYSTGLTGEKEDLNKNAPQERLITFATAAGAVFGLSVLPGDNSLLHRFFAALIFAGSAFAVQTAFPLIEQRIPPNLAPQVEPHKVTIFALLEIIIGNLILYIFSFVLPQSAVDSESSALAIILYSLVGLLFLEVGNLLSNNFLSDVAKLPPATVSLVRKAGAGAIIFSYVVLTVSYVLHFGPFGVARAA